MLITHHICGHIIWGYSFVDQLGFGYSLEFISIWEFGTWVSEGWISRLRVRLSCVRTFPAMLSSLPSILGSARTFFVSQRSIVHTQRNRYVIEFFVDGFIPFLYPNMYKSSSKAILFHSLHLVHYLKADD